MNPLNLIFLNGLAEKYPALCRTLEVGFWTAVVQLLGALSLYLTEGAMIDWKLIVASFLPAIIAGVSKRLRDISPK